MKYTCMLLFVGLSFLSLGANAAVKPFKCQAAVILNDYFEESFSIEEYPDVSYEYGTLGEKKMWIGSSLYVDGEDNVVVKDDLPNFGFRETVEALMIVESGYLKVTLTRDGTHGDIFVENKYNEQEPVVNVKVAELKNCSLITK